MEFPSRQSLLPIIGFAFRVPSHWSPVHSHFVHCFCSDSIYHKDVHLYAYGKSKRQKINLFSCWHSRLFHVFVYSSWNGRPLPVRQSCIRRMLLTFFVGAFSAVVGHFDFRVLYSLAFIVSTFTWFSLFTLVLYICSGLISGLWQPEEPYQWLQQVRYDCLCRHPTRHHHSDTQYGKQSTESIQNVRQSIVLPSKST